MTRGQRATLGALLLLMILDLLYSLACLWRIERAISTREDPPEAARAAYEADLDASP